MPRFKFKNIATYLFLLILAFLYTFGNSKIGGLNDLTKYFVNGLYMVNYGMEGVDGYPNQLFSLFLYYGYILTGNSFGLSYILFMPIYGFGIFSIYKTFIYFTKNEAISWLFTLILLCVNSVAIYTLNVHIYILYFFMFVSILYLCLYKKNIYIIAIYLAIASLFRNQLITFIPFLPFIINPSINKKDYFKTLLKLVMALAVVHFGFEVIKNLLLTKETHSDVNFSFYFTELKDNLFTLPNLNLIKTAIETNLSRIYFYYVLFPAIFLFNKKIYAKLDSANKKLLRVFWFLAMFIYFMPSIMYVNQITTYDKGYYRFLLNRYSFIMFVLLIPIYYSIASTIVYSLIVRYLKPKFYIVSRFVSVLITFIAFQHILNPSVYYNLALNSYNNFTINKNKFMFGANYKTIANVIKNNFSETDTILIDNYFFRSFFKPSQPFEFLDNKTSNYNYDGLMFLNDEYPSLLKLDDNTYKKIYTGKYNATITIYKRIN